MKHRHNAPPDLHALAQSLASASLSVDAARAFMSQGKIERSEASLAAAAHALECASRWMEDARETSGFSATLS